MRGIRERRKLSGMNTESMQADEARIGRARAHAARRRIGEAEAIYREVLESAPDTPEALNFVAMCALSRGDFASAQPDLEHAARIDPTEPEIWKNLGIVHLAQQHGDDALDAFDRALGLEPMHFAARLHRGAAFEQLGRSDAATAAYFGALAVAQSRGKWRNDVTTPPDLRPAVRHAITFLDAHRKPVFMELLQPLRERYGTTSLARIEQGLEIYLGAREAHYPDARQLCTFFHVPGLAAQPYHPRERFAWQDALERHAAVVREELRGVLAQPMGIEPWPGTHDDERLAQQDLAGGTGGNAQAFFFHRHGRRCETNAQRCPRTMEILNSLPLLHIRDHAPQTLFSMLAPGAHAGKRHGITNARLVTQLPLIVPGNCAIRVGGIEHAWREGQCVTFDDSFEHEAWNHGDAACAVLSLDSWHPDLATPEREALAVLFGGIDDFHRAAKVGIPPRD